MVIGASAGIPVATIDWALIDSHYRRGKCLGTWVTYAHPKTPHPYKHGPAGR